MKDAPSVTRLNNKWCMVGYKGCRCVKCGERVTRGTIEQFDLDHKVPVKNAHDKNDRWSGAIRDWPPGTDQWLAWGDKVELVCQTCHRKRHNPSKQLTLDLDVQKRLDDFADDGVRLIPHLKVVGDE